MPAGEAIGIGATIDGERRVIPLTGGMTEGNGFTGKVLNTGADFQLYPQGTAADPKAIYVIETDHGTLFRRQFCLAHQIGRAPGHVGQGTGSAG